MWIFVTLTLRNVIEGTGNCISAGYLCVFLQLLFYICEIFTAFIYQAPGYIMCTGSLWIAWSQTHLMPLIKHFLTIFLTSMNTILLVVRHPYTRYVALSWFVSRLCLSLDLLIVIVGFLILMLWVSCIVCLVWVVLLLIIRLRILILIVRSFQWWHMLFLLMLIVLPSILL